MMSRKPHFVTRRSPVAIGVLTARETRTSDAMDSGNTGSSAKNGFTSHKAWMI